jgi:hypothetical protein
MGTQTPAELPEKDVVENESTIEEDNWDEAWYASSDMDDATIAAVSI